MQTNMCKVNLVHTIKGKHVAFVILLAQPLYLQFCGRIKVTTICGKIMAEVEANKELPFSPMAI